MYPSGPKKLFADVIQDIITKNGGYIVSRKFLVKYCIEHNVSRPAILRHHHAGRGYFNLEPLVGMGKMMHHPSAAGAAGTSFAPPTPLEPVPELTDEEIETKTNAMFASLELFAHGVVSGDYRALIVAGNPGIGKTFNLELILEEAARNSKILLKSVRGYIRATGLYKLLYDHRWKDSVLLIDDADSVFKEETGLNLLKAALETVEDGKNKKRTISWRSEKRFETEDGEEIPPSFDYEGSIVFVSNIDFEREVAANTKLSPHMAALMSRSYYLDLNLRTARELVIRVKSVVNNTSMLSDLGISKKDQKIILQYIHDNKEHMREISLRTAIKLAKNWKNARGNYDLFKIAADATQLRKAH